METRIALLAKWFAIFAGLWCTALCADELLPSSAVHEFVDTTFEVRTEEGTTLFLDYYLISSSGRKMDIPIENFKSISKGDDLTLYITPIFKQLKAFACLQQRTGDTVRIGNPDVPREIPLIVGLAAIVFAVLSAFVVKRFELKVALAFFAIVVTAVRWWFIGV
jgi:hypothetical protein